MLANPHFSQKKVSQPPYQPLLFRNSFVMNDFSYISGEQPGISHRRLIAEGGYGHVHEVLSHTYSLYLNAAHL